MGRLISIEEFIPERANLKLTVTQPDQKPQEVRARFLGCEILGGVTFLILEEAKIKGRATEVRRYGLNADFVKDVEVVESEESAPKPPKKKKTRKKATKKKKTRKKKTGRKKVTRKSVAEPAKKKKVRRRSRSRR
jgi:hypothetical protein